jgi:acetoacetate decarboxylase
MLGGHPIMEFENLNRLVMGGREKWGYPKLYADISFADTPDGGVEVVVTMGSHKVIEMSWHPGEAPAPAEPAPAIKLVPHFTLRTLPSPSSPGMSFAEVLARDTSPDSKLKEQNAGKGSIKFNAWPQNEWDHTRLGGLAVKEIVSANRTVLDWYATEENGWARLVDRLI